MLFLRALFNHSTGLNLYRAESAVLNTSWPTGELDTQPWDWDFAGIDGTSIGSVTVEHERLREGPGTAT